MASKRLSPAATLLRHSRLFSLPPNLPAPGSDNPGLQGERFSETATLPYPVQPAIETTPKALSHGDWGMKRPLPGRAGRTSTPVIRVHEVDSIDHVTDYDSAADHVLTRQKWQEMDIPIMVDQQARSYAYLQDRRDPRSVFEDKMHHTAEDPAQRRDHRQRWRYGGPWVLGMPPYDFEEFVSKGLRSRKADFLGVVRQYLAQEKAQKSQGKALASGASVDKTAELTDTEFFIGLKRLRNDRHELWTLIWKFLDLPGVPPSQKPSSSNMFRDTIDQYLADSETGPPKTHPSAGLSYIRTSNHIYNHPILGPQRDRPPIRARVLQLGSTISFAKSGHDMLGVGGVVGTRQTTDQPLDFERRASANRFDDNLVGGTKTYVQPKQATITPNGRIKLELARATEDAAAVWDHRVGPGTAFNDADVIGSMASANQDDWKSVGDRARRYRSKAYEESTGKRLPNTI